MLAFAMLMKAWHALLLQPRLAFISCALPASSKHYDWSDKRMPGMT